jgi:hypothetical protein
MAELQSPQLRLSVQPRTFLIVRLHFSSIVSLLNPLRQVQVVRAHDAERSVRSAWIYVGARHGVGDRQRQVPVSPRLDRGWSSVHSLVAAPLLRSRTAGGRSSGVFVQREVDLSIHDREEISRRHPSPYVLHSL